MVESAEKNLKPLTNFFYELGVLKRVPRSGWLTINIKDPETVAEHSFRAAAIAYTLALLEGANPEHAAIMALFHDSHESRILDLHKISQRYIDTKPAESCAQKEQTEPLGLIGNDLNSFQKEFTNQKTKEAIIARDADLLECITQAREYVKAGFTDANDWIINAKKFLQTSSAKQLAEELEATDPNDWWRGLKNIMG